jgi:hypothetical protein
MDIRKRDFLKAVGGLAAAGTVLGQEGARSGATQRAVAGRGPAAARGGPAPVSAACNLPLLTIITSRAGSTK